LTGIPLKMTYNLLTDALQSIFQSLLGRTARSRAARHSAAPGRHRQSHHQGQPPYCAAFALRVIVLILRRLLCVYKCRRTRWRAGSPRKETSRWSTRPVGCCSPWAPPASPRTAW
jgi:hypothetical protein